MGTTGRTVEPYLPTILRQWIAEEPDSIWRELTGSLVLVDVSGFTRLSERLARIGRAGAEELSEAIGSCFSRLLSDAYGNGGMLLKFGGDALLLLFTGEDHAPRACRSAAAMRGTLADVGRLETPVGPVRLRMSVGIHSGPLALFLVGTSHRELVVAGPGVTSAVRMEQAAEAGRIVVSPGTAARLPDAILGGPEGGGWLLRRAPTGLSPVGGACSVTVPETALQQCLPEGVRLHLATGTDEPEHRQVTVAFVRFSEVDATLGREGVAGAAYQLHALVSRVQRAADAHGVTFLGTDVDADGGKIILAAGAPLALGDEDERMLLALRDVVDSAAGPPVRAGVHRGAVFAGDIGPSYRRTYTVMGDAVNLAARLMAKAGPGQILATPAVLERSRTVFQTAVLPPFSVKGKRLPVTAFEVREAGESQDRGTLPPLVGREPELSVLQAGLDGVGDGAGQLIALVGEPGIGKSRLVAELRARAGRSDVLDLACQVNDAASPYAAWRAVLRTLLDVPLHAPPRVAGARLRNVLAEQAPALLPWAPLIGTVVDAVVPETREMASLDPRFRRGRLREATLDLLEALVQQPAVLVAEDAHWMDEASADLLQHLADRLPRLPLLVCVTRREGGTGFVPASAPSITTVRLEPLGPEAATALARATSEAAPLPRHELEELVDRAGGNPLFLSELVAAASAAGGIEDLPGSIEALITARIDRLPGSHRACLRRLSVLGSSFAPALVDAVLPPGLPLDEAALADFVTSERGTLRFRHALIRDVAYGSLPYRTRRTLHAAVGDAIAGCEPPPPDVDAELSYHYFHAGRHEAAWRHSLAAAREARAAYANAAACVLLERALSSARQIPRLAPEVARLREELGDVRDHMGMYAEAAEAYRAARRGTDDEPVTDARLMGKIAWQQGWLRRYSQSLRWLRRGLRRLEGAAGEEAARQRAQLTVWEGHFLQEQGRHQEALARTRDGIRLAQRCGDLEALAHAYRTLDWAQVCLGELDLAVHSPRALALYEELGDLRGQSMVLNNMAAIAYWRGRWDEALQCNRRSEDLSRRIGDEVSVGFSLGNIGEILSDQGHLEEAEHIFAEVLRVSLAGGRRSQVAFSQRNLGRIAVRSGRLEEGLALLEEARTAYVDLGARVELTETQARMAEAHLVRGEPGRALPFAEEALDGLRALGGIPAQAPAVHRIHAHVLLQLGEIAPAAEALEEALSAARAREAAYEIALTVRSLAVLGPLVGSPPGPELIAEAEATFLRLGVVALPALPLCPVPLEVAG